MSGPSGNYQRGRRALHIVLLGLLLLLASMALGCDEIVADILTGDTCGDHAVCSRHVAAAGAGAAVVGAAGAYLQRVEDGSKSPLPWDEDEAEWEAEFDDALSDGTVTRDESAPWEETGELGPDEDIDDILGPDEDGGKAGTGTATGESSSPTDGQDQEPDVDEEGEYAEEPDESEMEDESEAEGDGEGGDKAEEGDKAGATTKDKPKSPATPYVPLTTVGDVTILVDPDTGRIAVIDGTYIGGKDKNGYWITKDNKVVKYNHETGEATVSDGQFTAEKDGTTYTLTDDNKILSYDTKGNVKISDGHFVATRNQEVFTVTKDNKVISYDHMSGGIKVSDGHFTATRENDVYTVTKDNRVLHFDKKSGDLKISDGHFTATRENDVYTVTKDNKILHFDKNNGDIKVSDGHFTATRENQVYSLTKDNKVLSYNKNNGDFKITDGHYVVEREGSTTVFTKDNVAIEYDKDTHGVVVSTQDQKGQYAVGVGRDGQFGVAANVKGSMGGTPTTFGLTVTKYNMPETGGQGFAGGVSLEQKDFSFQAAYLKEAQDRGVNVDVRADKWTAGFHKLGGTKDYNLGWRNIQLGYERGVGDTVKTAGVRLRF